MHQQSGGKRAAWRNMFLVLFGAIAVGLVVSVVYFMAVCRGGFCSTLSPIVGMFSAAVAGTILALRTGSHQESDALTAQVHVQTPKVKYYSVGALLNLLIPGFGLGYAFVGMRTAWRNAFLVMVGMVATAVLAWYGSYLCSSVDCEILVLYLGVGIPALAIGLLALVTGAHLLVKALQR